MNTLGTNKKQKISTPTLPSSPSQNKTFPITLQLYAYPYP